MKTGTKKFDKRTDGKEIERQRAGARKEIIKLLNNAGSMLFLCTDKEKPKTYFIGSCAGNDMIVLLDAINKSFPELMERFLMRKMIKDMGSMFITKETEETKSDDGKKADRRRAKKA